MPAAQFDFEIQQGATLPLEFSWEDVNEVPLALTGYSIAMQVRPYPGSTRLFLEASTANGLITFGNQVGRFKLLLPKALTRAQTWAKGKYDVVLTSPSGFVTRILQGTVTVSKRVTRDE